MDLARDTDRSADGPRQGCVRAGAPSRVLADVLRRRSPVECGVTSPALTASDVRVQPTSRSGAESAPFWAVFRGRLAQFRSLSDHQTFWHDRWSRRDIAAFLSSYRTGRLDEFDEIFSRYLPRELPTLEAGCGCGQLVAALSARGYRVEGVDYEAETIARV